MVGVPRSKGCRICVQRRVKCDQTRPVCNNCLKGNRPCPGYGQTIKFQNEGPALEKKYSRQSDAEPTPEEKALADIPLVCHSFRAGRRGGGGLKAHGNRLYNFVEGKTSKYASVDFDSPSFLWGESPDNHLLPNLRGLFNPPPGLTITSPIIMQDQLLHAFSTSMAPSHSGTYKPIVSHGRWLSYLPEMTGSNSLLDTAIRAVTLVHIGRIKNNESFLHESRPHYGKALRLLNAAIADPVDSLSSKTLCATILLSFYEMFASDEDSTWVRHAGGAGALMRMRGAQRHRYGLDCEMFLAYRYTLLIESLQKAVYCFLAEPEWRALSRQIYGDVRETCTVHDEKLSLYDATETFYDTVTSVTIIISDAQRLRDKARETGVSMARMRASIMDKINAARKTLKRTSDDLLDVLVEIGQAPATRATDDPIFPFETTFTNVFISSYFVACNGVVMMLNFNAIGLHEAVAEDATEYREQNRELAQKSCQCVNFMLGSSFIGPFVAILALRLASRVYVLGEPEWDWIVAKLWDIGDKHMMIAKYIPWYNKQDGDPVKLKAAIARANYIGRIAKEEQASDRSSSSSSESPDASGFSATLPEHLTRSKTKAVAIEEVH